ncbi:MAG: integrase core domain-containing protein [Chloroflexota bacterium]|nr:integrase core domain-containing protein [Chloroflexota bacterium]
MTDDLVALIKRVAKENLTWGAERIRGELLKLGIRVSKSTIQKYMNKERKSRVFVIIELGSRRVVHFGVTRNPTDQWTAQQLREATPYGEGPRFLIRDDDGKFGPSFARVAKGTGIEVLKTPRRAPRANAICERFLGSLRRECLDHFLILGERHLHRVVKKYKTYFNHARPHQGIEQRIPCRPERPEPPPASGKVASRPVLSGLHHSYFWQAADSVGRGAHQSSGYLH